jgi:hypothetical protein
MRSISDQRAIGYLAWLFAVALVWAVCSVILTVAVDPYRMYGTPAVPGWTELKPRIDQQTAVAKTNQLERVIPKTLLLGNSRVDIGFDPESKAWPSAYRPVFNAAESGTGLQTALEMLQEDIAVRPPRTVFVELDFQDFLSRQDKASAPAPPIGADERRLLVTRRGEKNDARTLQIWRDRFATTLTFDALTDSVLTILDQDPKTTATMTQTGFNPLHEYTLYAQRIGYYGLFIAKAKDYQQQYLSYRRPNFTDASQLANFRDLHMIAALARQHHIELIFFTQPYHMDYLEMLHRLALWPSFEEWKRTIARFSSKEGFPLYDFANYNAFTTEEVPDRGDTVSEMHWYWEPGHYKETLGEEMLNAMVRGNESFGRRLTPANVEAAIADIRSARQLYLAQQSEPSRSRLQREAP